MTASCSCAARDRVPRAVKLPDGTELASEELERKLHKMIAFRKYLQIVERRLPVARSRSRPPRARRARQGVLLGSRAVDGLAAALEEPQRTVSVQSDEEHQAFALAIEDRSAGYTRHYRIDLDFVTTVEFRTLLGSYQDVRGIRGPMVVTTLAGAAREEAAEEGDGASDPAAADAGPPLDQAARPAESRSIPKTDVKVDSLDELVALFIAAGEKGITINRYKGLGEMNPDTLWETTMRPESRTLLQVRAEDHTEADLMFTTLMGDQVEPRRKFIEDNALDVKNLDV